MNNETTVIEVRNVSKFFKLYNKPIERLKEVLLPWGKIQHKQFYAIKDVSFNVKNGETVGIVGKNGSGKSTMLKMITGILTPSSGAVKVRGKISSLLELGAGFNPELSGLDNVYLNGTIMGFSKEEMDRKIESILEFADIGEFIKQPVKNYSSGMYVRLAFATAITVEPEILIVDEALAVGDVAFQNKCYRKFEQLKKQGTTILFVTHAIELIARHCDRAILINEGHLLADGHPNEIVNMYMDLVTSPTASRELVAKEQKNNEYEEKVTNNPISTPNFLMGKRTYNKAEYRWGDGRAKIIDYNMIVDGESDPARIKSNSIIDLYVKYHFYEAVDNFMCGITLKTIDGIIIFAYNTRVAKISLEPKTSGDTLLVKFSFKNTLVSGKYTISLGCSQNVEHSGEDHIPIDRRNDLIILDVLNDMEISGIIDPDIRFDECKNLSGDEMYDSFKSPVNYIVTQ